MNERNNKPKIRWLLSHLHLKCNSLKSLKTFLVKESLQRIFEKVKKLENHVFFFKWSYRTYEMTLLKLANKSYLMFSTLLKPSLNTVSLLRIWHLPRSAHFTVGLLCTARSFSLFWTHAIRLLVSDTYDPKD